MEEQVFAEQKSEPLCNERLEECPIVLACDEAFAMPVATAIRSIVEANRDDWPLNLHVLVADVTEGTRVRIASSVPAESVRIHWIPIDVSSFKGIKVTGHLNRMTYARLLLPYVLPEGVSKVLFLDADTLVFQSLRSLRQVNLEGAVVGAVLDAIDPLIKTNDPRVASAPRVRRYFNAGVLLVDIDRWRSERISERAIEYLEKGCNMPYCDQDALNVVCDGLWRQLDPIWNFQDHLRTSIESLEPGRRPAVAHFVTSVKPWNPRVRNLNARLYDAFRSRTAYARTSGDKVRDVLTSGLAQIKRGVKRCLRLQSSPFRNGNSVRSS